MVPKGLGLWFGIALACSSAACGGRSAVPRPFPTPGGTARSPVAAPASPMVESLLRTATDLLGTPYRNGGSTVEGFDCSGFVWYVLGQHGIVRERGREMRAENAVGRKIGISDRGGILLGVNLHRRPGVVGGNRGGGIAHRRDRDVKLPLIPAHLAFSP